MSSSRPAPSRYLVLTVMCVGYFLVLLDVTVVNVALPGIASDLGSSVAGRQWVVDGYSLALAALLLGSGAIGDLRGHKRIVLLGLAVFGVASLGCGLAPDTGVLVGARVVQGIGAALLLPGTLAIITDAFPERREQARAIGVWAAVGSAALPAGPLLGGALVNGPGWRWVFFINVPIVLVAIVVAAFRVPASRAGRDASIDRSGIVLGALALVGITFTVIQAGHAGFDAAAVVALAVGVVALVLFLRAEARTAQPMLPLALFRRPAFSTANATAGAMNLGTLGLLFLLTTYLQTVQHRSALLAGVAVLPLFLPLSVLAPAAGRVAARRGPRPVMVLGLVIAAVGTGLVATWRPDTSYAVLVPAMLLWGIGLGVLTPAVVTAAVAAAPPERSGLASGINNTARQAGGAIGIAAYGAIAGEPDAAVRFVSGLQVCGLITAGLFLLAAVVTTIFVRT